MDHKTFVFDCGGADKWSVPAGAHSVAVEAGRGGAGGGGSGYYQPGDNQRPYDGIDSAGLQAAIARHNDRVRNAHVYSARLREDVMLALLGKGFPMPQVIAWALEAVKIAEAYPEEHRGSFMAALRASFSDPKTCCDASIQEAKEAADFIISGTATR